MDKNQQGIFSKADNELLKNSFSGEGEELLYEIRNVLLQFSSGLEKKLSFELLAVIRKFILPEINSDTPLTVQSDLYFSLDNLKQIPPEVAQYHIMAMDKMVAYISERFDVLEGLDVINEMFLKDLKEKYNKTEEERFIDLIAYQSIVAYIDTSLDRLRTISNKKEQTEEELEKMQLANSSK